MAFSLPPSHKALTIGEPRQQLLYAVSACSAAGAFNSFRVDVGVLWPPSLVTILHGHSFFEDILAYFFH